MFNCNADFWLYLTAVDFIFFFFNVRAMFELAKKLPDFYSFLSPELFLQMFPAFPSFILKKKKKMRRKKHIVSFLWHSWFLIALTCAGYAFYKHVTLKGTVRAQGICSSSTCTDTLCLGNLRFWGKLDEYRTVL